MSIKQGSILSGTGMVNKGGEKQTNQKDMAGTAMLKLEEEAKKLLEKNS